MSWGGKGKGYPGSSFDTGWTCQNCGQDGNWHHKVACRSCYQLHPLLAKGQKGKGKQKGNGGKYTDTTRVCDGSGQPD
eukprot:7152829-Heterocapsa_arctica.AAC.1